MQAELSEFIKMDVAVFRMISERASEHIGEGAVRLKNALVHVLGFVGVGRAAAQLHRTGADVRHRRCEPQIVPHNGPAVDETFGLVGPRRQIGQQRLRCNRQQFTALKGLYAKSAMMRSAADCCAVHFSIEMNADCANAREA